MTWIEIKPEKDDWQKQYNLIAYNEDNVVGSIILDSDGDWNSLIDDTLDFMDCSSLKEAKEEFYDRIELFIEDYIKYYKKLFEMLNELKEE